MLDVGQRSSQDRQTKSCPVTTISGLPAHAAARRDRLRSDRPSAGGTLRRIPETLPPIDPTGTALNRLSITSPGTRRWLLLQLRHWPRSSLSNLNDAERLFRSPSGRGGEGRGAVDQDTDILNVLPLSVFLAEMLGGVDYHFEEVNKIWCLQFTQWSVDSDVTTGRWSRCPSPSVLNSTFPNVISSNMAKPLVRCLRSAKFRNLDSVN